MKRSVISSCCLGLVVAGGMFAVPMAAARPEPTKPAAGGAPQMDPKMMEAMKRMEEHGALNENHGYLKQFEGEWDCNMKWWMNEGGPAIANKVTSSAKVGYDGHFLIEKVQGNVTMAEGMPPSPFSGMAIMGYDNQKKQFSSTWIDNMCGSVMTQHGSASQGGKVFTFEGDSYCPMNDKVCHFKSVCTVVDANTRKMEMWGPGLDGKVFKSMEIMYTRKK